MAGFIVKQPNGLYCRFSTVVGTVTNWNMTEEDYVRVLMMRGYDGTQAAIEAREVIEDYLQPFSEVLKCFRPINNTVEEFTEWVKLVGYKENDLDKWIAEWNEWLNDEDKDDE